MGRQPWTRWAFVSLGCATLAASTVAWSGPADTTDAGRDAADCQFAIRASNNLSLDVWVMLYDSRVSNQKFGVFGGYTQLKIQNHRIASGKTMDRRYTASGRCAADRTWLIVVKRGSQPFEVEYRTGGDGSESRTVDIGPSSRWEPRE
jgi:hypothetical protein